MDFIKNLLKLILLVGVIVYLGYSFAVVVHENTGEVCKALRVEVSDSTHAGFITADGVEEILHKEGLYPVGQPMDSVNTKSLQERLLKNPFIMDAMCYKSPGGMLNIIIVQRVPVLRIISDTGQNYYLDDKGYKMRHEGYDADLVVVTGQVDDKFARNKLVPIGILIHSDPFWDNQLEQIQVTADKELVLFTRVGDQPVYAGRAENMERKLNNLRAFYEKVLPDVGWNRYKAISIAYENQVVCTK